MLLGIACGHLKDTAAPAKAADAKELDFSSHVAGTPVTYVTVNVEFQFQREEPKSIFHNVV